MAKIVMVHGRETVSTPNEKSPIHHLEITPPAGTKFFQTETGVGFEFAKGHEKVIEDWLLSLADGVNIALIETDSKPREPKTRDELRIQQAARAEQKRAESRVMEKQAIADEEARKLAEKNNVLETAAQLRKDSTRPPIHVETVTVEGIGEPKTDDHT